MAETDEQVEQEQAPEDGAPKSFKQRLPLIAAIIVGLAVGGGSGAAVIGPIVVKKMGIAPDPSAADSAAAHEIKAAEGDGKTAPAAPPVHTLENLVLNPAGSGGQRFLLFTVAIECTTAKGIEEMTNRDAELRDIILTTLGTRTTEYLTEISNREAIKLEIVNAVSEKFGKKTIKHLYFPQFVIQ